MSGEPEKPAEELRLRGFEMCEDKEAFLSLRVAQDLAELIVQLRAEEKDLVRKLSVCKDKLQAAEHLYETEAPKTKVIYLPPEKTQSETISIRAENVRRMEAFYKRATAKGV